MVANALAVRGNNALLPAQQDLQTVTQLARIATDSGLAKVSDEVKASFIILKGLELGIPPFTALGGIFITETWNKSKGRSEATIGLTVPLMLGLVQGSGSLEDILIPDPAKVQGSATVTVKRKGQSPFTFTFTRDMAQKMSLLDKFNWKSMENVMLVNRAISGALRPIFADVLQGLYLVEEINPDVEVSEDSTPIQVVTPPAPQLSSTTPENVTTLEQPQNTRQDAPQSVSSQFERKQDVEFKWYEDDAKIDALLDVWAREGVTRADVLRLAKVENGDWSAYATGKAASEAIKAALDAEMSATPPAQPKAEATPPGWVDLKQEFPNDYGTPAQTAMPERYTFTHLTVSTFKHKTTGADEYKLSFRTDAKDADGKLITASTFNFGKYITMNLLTEEQLRAKATVELVGVTGEIEQSGKYWNVVDGSVVQDLPF